MLTTRRRAVLVGILAHLLLAVFVAGAGSAHAAAAIETMPLWRLQVIITTGGDSDPADTDTTDDEGTDGNPALRFNGSTTGVRTLNPQARSAFDRGHEDRYDLRLFGSPSEMTMLRVGIAGTDSWCVEKIELRFNGRTAFVGEPGGGGGSCALIRGGSYLEYSFAQLRNAPEWKDYGTPPPLPSRMSAFDLRTLVRDVTGSAILGTPNLRWNTSLPLTVVRKTVTSIQVSYSYLVYDPNRIGNPFPKTATYIVRTFVGSDGRLHAALSTFSDSPVIAAVVSQLDTALARMTARPGPHDPLRFAVDSGTNITWSYTPVLAP